MLTRAALKRRLAADRLSETKLLDEGNTTVGPKLRSSDEQTENTQPPGAVSEAAAPSDSTPPQGADPGIRIRRVRNERLERIPPPSPTLIALDHVNLTAAHSVPRETVATSGTVVSKIEAIMETIVDQLLEMQDMSINLVSRKSAARGHTNNRLHPVRFTSRSNVEATKFARVLLILQLSHSALVSGIILTKRNIYYQHQELFKSQQVVDQLVDDIAVMLNVNRHDLNIVASAKGLVVGAMLFQFHDGSSLDVTLRDEGTLLPTTNSISSIDICTSRWLLVIEKDATFRSLASSEFWRTSLAGRGILVTAKGYPDLSTRTFLNLISSMHPSLPIFILADYDPDGIGIFSCYHFGSDALAHETQASNLRATWLGVKAEHVLERQSVMRADDSSQAGTSSITNCFNSVLPLSVRDRTFACRALSRAIGGERDYLEVRRELQLLLILNVKAEIQSLDEAGNLEHWLDHEILSHLQYNWT